MIARVTLGRRRSWSGRIIQFRIARTALALPWHVLFPSSIPLGAVARERRSSETAAPAAAPFLDGSVQFTFGDQSDT